MSRDAGTNSLQVVTFKLGAEEYGADIMKIQEIILMGEITRLPQVPEFVEGVINLRGNVIPIIDLRTRLGMPRAVLAKETRIIVVNVERKTIGIVVDAVSEVLRIPDASIDAPPRTGSGIRREYITGIGKLAERLIILLDMDRVLSVEEMEASARVAAEAAQALAEDAETAK